jgi:hypothetical protein
VIWFGESKRRFYYMQQITLKKQKMADDSQKSKNQF